MSSDLEQGRYDQLIRRLGNMTGPGSRVAEVLSELFPVIDVERVPAELLFLAGWRIGVGSQQSGAEAASISKIQLFNPVDSGHLIVLTRVDFATTVTTIVEATTSLGALTTNVGGTILRDTRIGNTAQTVGQVRSQTDATGLPPTWQIRSLSNINHVLSDDNGIVVLAPGTGYTMAPNTVNQFLIASFMWRERPAEPSELLF